MYPGQKYRRQKQVTNNVHPNFNNQNQINLPNYYNQSTLNNNNYNGFNDQYNQQQPHNFKRNDNLNNIHFPTLHYTPQNYNCNQSNYTPNTPTNYVYLSQPISGLSNQQTHYKFNGNFNNNDSSNQKNNTLSQAIPNNQPHPSSVNNSIEISNCQGRKKAVYIGINYFGQKGQLRGCINDVNNIRNFLAQNYGFKPENSWVLTDDQIHQPGNMPTKHNIIRAMQWLVRDARPNDSLFFHYSGHGGQKEDLDGDEEDGFDETILPVDYKVVGEIVDDEMNAIMVQPLPIGCRLTAIFDSCHSGTALDLPYVYNSHGQLISYNPKKAAMTSAVEIGKKYLMGDKIGALMSLKKGFDILTKGSKAEKITQKTRGSMADVIMFSGCADSQTSADTQVASVSTGAMSYAFIQTLKSNPYGLSYIQLLNGVRNFLKQKYSQVPQLSSGRPMDMNYLFIL